MPSPGSLLVAVKAAGLNPSDAKNVLGRCTKPKYPGFRVAILSG